MHLDPNRIRTCIANGTGLRFVTLALIVLGCVVGNQVNAVEDRFPQMLDLLASTKASDNYRGCALAREVWTRQKGFNPIQVRQLLPILMAMVGDKTVAEHIHAYAARIRTFSATGLPWQSEWTAYVRAVLALRTTIVNLAALPTQTVRDQAVTRAVADVQRRYATLVSAMGEVGGTLPADLPPILLSVLPPTDVAKP